MFSFLFSKTKTASRWIQNLVFWPIGLQIITGCAGEMSSLFSAPVLKQMHCIYVCNIPERTGQILRQGLQNTLCSNSCNAAYELKITISEIEETMALGVDARTMLAHLETKAHYQLIRKSDQKCLKEGTVSAHNSYDVLSSDHQKVFANIYYSSTKAIDFAKNTNLEKLKDLLLQEIALFFQQHPCSLSVRPQPSKISVTQYLDAQKIK